MSGGVIAMSGLGSQGRFGNQVIQYMFLKTYARTHGLEVQVPPWIGNTLFGADDPPVVAALTPFEEPWDKEPERMVIPRLEMPLRDVDVSGYFQYPSAYYAPHQAYIRRLFTPVPSIRTPLDEALDRVRGSGRTLVALHIRRRDYGWKYYYIVPTSWYARWLDTIWDRLDRPLLYIATDDARVVRKLGRFEPITARDLRVPMPGAPFYPDFYTLSRADVLAIPNSSFSFVAAMFNERLREAWRSHLSDPLEDPPFRRFDPWDAPMMSVDTEIARFPGIPDIGRPRRKGLLRIVNRLERVFGRDVV